MCRRQHRGGVSPQARGYYDQFLKLVAPRHAGTTMYMLTTSEVQRKLSTSFSLAACHELLNCLYETVVDARQKEGLAYLLKHMRNNKDAVFNKDFQLISAPYIIWGK